MSSALPGEHLCLKHQGNHSHYASENCTICQQEQLLDQCREALEGKQDFDLLHARIVVHLQRLRNPHRVS
jgi:hypothetical protein